MNEYLVDLYDEVLAYRRDLESILHNVPDFPNKFELKESTAQPTITIEKRPTPTPKTDNRPLKDPFSLITLPTNLTPLKKVINYLINIVQAHFALKFTKHIERIHRRHLIHIHSLESIPYTLEQWIVNRKNRELHPLFLFKSL